MVNDRWEHLCTATITVGPMDWELEKMPTLEQVMAVCLDKNDDVAEVIITNSHGDEQDRVIMTFDASGRMDEESKDMLWSWSIAPTSEVSEIIHSVDWERETARWIFIVRP